MKKVCISLGSSCDAAAALKRVGMRVQSYPFDWLWNISGGITYITQMLSSDFKNVLDRSSYMKSRHWRFGEEKEVIVYKYYPEIVHIHGNPLENSEEHLKLQRRFQRLMDLLCDNTWKKCFLYQVNIDEIRMKNMLVSDQEIIEYQLKECNVFIDLLCDKYPKIVYEFLIVFQTDIVDEKFILDLFGLKRNKLSGCFVNINRDDNDQIKSDNWQKQWTRGLIRNGYYDPFNILRRVMEKFFGFLKIFRVIA
jgi:hypothetical protein